MTIIIQGEHRRLACLPTPHLLHFRPLKRLSTKATGLGKYLKGRVSYNEGGVRCWLWNCSWIPVQRRHYGSNCIFFHNPASDWFNLTLSLTNLIPYIWMQPREATNKRQSKLVLVGDAVGSSRAPQGPGPWVTVGECLFSAWPRCAGSCSTHRHCGYLTANWLVQVLQMQINGWWLRVGENITPLK